ncbi:hypothetical protein SAMN02745164_00023 [Marinitoga hydrogenitolerans DSM 16785]|uniref:Lipoprotein n=1 Tax=Marinitoga hydrogenitolerans (strain DSM 16785 / JCM 12826 / AT1271) TaxID=1122195 RepID=A0A1M4S4P3_MARH1|nr:hypothetical protein [Marinitoga hydrogenitolerans]SHE27165.1 hypothetical protein SAMN02745164_00023 [Marinitoga hydrogenitolerans DSM 16785]
MRKLLFLLLFISIIFISCSTQPKQEPYEYFSSSNENFTEIIVEGKGITLEEAESNARVQALQNIVGMKVFNQTIVRNFKLVDKTILSKTYGFIKGSEILQKNISDGIYTVKVKYEVSKNLGDEDFFYILQQMKKPKIGVKIKNFSHYKDLNRISENSIESELSKLGFNLFDSTRIKEISNNLQLANEGLDILITGQISAEYSGSYYGLETARSKIILKAYWTSTGKLIASISDESGGSDVTKLTAVKTSVKKASEIAGEKLAKKILKTWMDYLANGLPIEIVVLDITNKEYETITNKIKTLFKLYSYNYSNGKAIFEIESNIFADEIYNLYFKDYKLITQNITYLVIK